MLGVLAAGGLVAALCAGLTLFALQGMATRQVRAAGVTLDVPADWESVPVSVPGGRLQYGAPFDAERGGVREQIYAAATPTPYDAEQYAAQSVQAFVDVGGTVERNVPAELDGIAGREVEVTLDHVDGSYVQLQRVVIRDASAWVVACVGPARRFEEVRPRCEAVFESVRFAD